MICGEKCPRKIRVSLVFILMTVSGSGAAAKPDVTQFVAVIDFDCTAPSSLPQGELAHLARQTTQKLGSRGVAAWADRAWALDLGGEPEPQYFVPPDWRGTPCCGGTAVTS